MPLLKLLLKEEQALATPELCRQAPKDDPRALLAAADFSDLVGVVRTLGELSDYAAVVFHQLHKETLNIGARGDALATRLSALEESTPEAELRVFTAPDTPQLLSNPGTQWRANPPADQHLFTHSELPPYIGEAYMGARPPPPLHALDRFNQTVESGAALRRYTDPSFFKREWALAELAQAEREKKARKAKRKAKHQAERSNSHDLQEAAYAKQPSRSRRTPRSLAAAASATPTPLHVPPLVASDARQRYSVYVPNEAPASSTPGSERYADAPSDLPTPLTQGTISPYVGSSIASPQERDWGLGHDRTGLASSIGDVERDGTLVDEQGLAGDGLRESEMPRVATADDRWSLDAEQSSNPTKERGSAGSASVGAEMPAVASGLPAVGPEMPGASAGMAAGGAGLPAVGSVRRTDSQLEAAVSREVADADKGMLPLENVQEQPIPRARRRTARVDPISGIVQRNNDGEGETQFPRAESFDSVKQAGRVREQLEKEADLAKNTGENGRTEGNRAAANEDPDEVLQDDIGTGVSADKAGRPSRLETGRTDVAKELEGVWETAPAGAVRKADAVATNVANDPADVTVDVDRDPADVTADMDRDPADVTSDVDQSSPEGHGPQNGRLPPWAATPGEESVVGDSAPGSPVHPGLQKLQLEYQQAQARLEALLRMQRELEEQVTVSGGAVDGNLVTNGVNQTLGAVPSAASLAVELSRSSLGGVTEGEGPGQDSPPETEDIDSPAWSTLSSPVHVPLVPRFHESPGLPGGRHFTVLDSPGPCGRRLPGPDSSIHMSPPRETSPGGFTPSPFSSPERSSPLRRPWSLAGPHPDEPLSALTDYQPTRLSTETSLLANQGAATSVVPTPPTKPLPKPPPLPPPGSLAISRKPPPPPPPLAPGALTISGPSSSRGGATNLMQAIAQHDKGKLKRVDAREPGSVAPAADRNVMLEQIKRGVNLRPTEPVKAEQKPSRAAVDVNVASILARANAIRQAMQDSDDDDDDDDEDDDWSD